MYVFHEDSCDAALDCGCEELNETRVQEAVATGNRVTILKTMRTVLGERLDRATSRESASMSRQIQVLTDQITELEGVTNDKPDPLKDSTEKWAARMASATDLYPTALCRLASR